MRDIPRYTFRLLPTYLLHLYRIPIISHPYTYPSLPPFTFILLIHLLLLAVCCCCCCLPCIKCCRNYDKFCRYRCPCALFLILSRTYQKMRRTGPDLRSTASVLRHIKPTLRHRVIDSIAQSQDIPYWDFIQSFHQQFGSEIQFEGILTNVPNS